MAPRMTGIAKIGEVEGRYVATEEEHDVAIEVDTGVAKFTVRIPTRDLIHMAEVLQK